MKLKYLSLLVLVAALAACPPPKDDDDDDDAPGACTAEDVPCRDDSLAELSMQPFDVTAGAIETDDEGDHFHTRVNATVGGVDGVGYVYGKFESDGLKRVELTDDESFDSMDWDVSFHRFIIRLNSGTGGPSCVSGARTGEGTDFATLDGVDENLDFNIEQYMSTDTCDIIPDGSGLGSPGTVLQNFWSYAGCVAMTGNVYVLELADGHHVKLVVTHFYSEAAQIECNEEDTIPSPSGSGNVQLDWAFID